MVRFILILIGLGLPFFAWGQNFQELKLKDYGEMRALISTFIQKAKKASKEQGDSQEESEDTTEEILFHLKEGLKILFTRPDSHRIRQSLLPLLEQEIMLHRPFLRVLRGMVAQQIAVLKSKESTHVSQANALFFLENAMAYAQGVPISSKKADSIFLDIKEAKIKISKELKNYLVLTAERGERKSPSSMANKFLKMRWKKRAEWEKEKKRAAQKKEESKNKK